VVLRANLYTAVAGDVDRGRSATTASRASQLA
jgi:hypothetical protein